MQVFSGRKMAEAPLFDSGARTPVAWWLGLHGSVEGTFDAVQLGLVSFGQIPGFHCSFLSILQVYSTIRRAENEFNPSACCHHVSKTFQMNTQKLIFLHDFVSTLSYCPLKLAG